MSATYTVRQAQVKISERDFLYSRSSRKSLQRLFRKKVDTLKVHLLDQTLFLHFSKGGIETFTSRLELRRELSQESGGAWVEQTENKKRYFLDVEKEEFLQESQHLSLLSQRITGLALATLRLARTVVEIAQQLPSCRRDLPTLSSEIVGQKFDVEGQTVSNDDGSTSYQLVFEQTSCTEFGIGSKFSSMLSLTSQL